MPSPVIECVQCTVNRELLCDCCKICESGAIYIFVTVYIHVEEQLLLKVHLFLIVVKYGSK